MKIILIRNANGVVRLNSAMKLFFAGLVTDAYRQAKSHTEARIFNRKSVCPKRDLNMDSGFFNTAIYCLQIKKRGD